MTEQEAKDKSMRGRSVALWAGVIGAPLVWGIQLEVGYALPQWVCKHGGVTTFHTITVICAALALVAGVLSWRDWRRAGGGSPEKTDGGPVARDRFLGVLGMLSSLLSIMLIIAQGFASVYFDACWT